MRILVVDDHEIVRRGVSSLLDEQDGFEVCGEALDGRDAIRKAADLRPHVIVMDVSMPNMNGLDAAREIKILSPSTQIVILSQHDSPEMVRQALNAGASAYVVKSAMSTDLVAALEKIQRGEDLETPRVFGSTRSNVDLQEILQRSAAFESALRDSEERFRLTFEYAAVGIAQVAEDGRWLRVNRKLREMMGYTPEQPVNVRFQDVTHPDDVQRDVTNYKKLAAGELTQYIAEKRYIRQDGSVVWANLTAVALRDADGHLKYFISAIEDITARKRAEKAIAGHVRRLKSLYKFADDLNRTDTVEQIYLSAFEAILGGLRCDRASILLFDQDGVMRFVASRGLSDAYRAATEGHSPWKRSEHNAQPVSMEDVATAPLEKSLRAVIEREGIRALAFIPLALDHALIGKFMVYYNQPHKFDAEEIDFCLTVARQLAAGISRCQAAQALAEKASLLELSTDAIVVRDPDDHIVYWNNGAREIYGFTREEAIGRVSHDLLSTKFPDPLERIRRTLFAEGRWNGNLIHIAKDGSRIIVSSRWTVARDAEGDLTAILETNRDITGELALRKMQEEFARKQREKLPAKHKLGSSRRRSKSSPLIPPSA